MAKEDKQAANSYLQLLQARLSQQWNRPKSARRGMETLIELRLVPTGRIVGVEILESSGELRLIDQSSRRLTKRHHFQSYRKWNQEFLNSIFAVLK
jgi:colicin import membrane protein